MQETETGLHQPLPAPMNNNYKAQNNKGQVGLGDPIKYKNVRLAKPLGPFDKGDSFEVATVENYRGQVRWARARTHALRRRVLHHPNNTPYPFPAHSFKCADKFSLS